MSKHMSPFAALTCQEKHLKWLEYQSIRLPYVQANVDPAPLVQETVSEEKKHAEADAKTMPCPVAQKQPDVPTAKPVPSPQADYFKPRHRQYDAVIARMKQAEMRTRNYTSVQ